MTAATGARMSVEESVVRYVFNPQISRFTVQAFAGGLLSSFGHNPTIAIRDYDGVAQFIPDSFESASLRVTIRSASLELADDVSAKDRREIETTMSAKVLEIDTCPQIVFQSTQISATNLGEARYSVQITGDLNLHGTTRSHSFDTRVAIDGDSLRAFGEFSVRQTDYGISLVSVAGGTLKIKDELRCSFNVVARKQG
jgi:polyisoprenoid-binding protein YceI